MSNANKQDAGGLPELPPPWSLVGMDEDFPVFSAAQMRAYGELCRAAPAGGDPARGKIDPSWSLFDRVDFALRDAGFDLDEASDIAALAAAQESALAGAHTAKDSAPDGSGEVEELVQFVHAEISAANGYTIGRLRAALLRKLQQGAE